MEICDLMIGDIVTFKDCQNDKKPVIIKIWSINQDGEAFAFIDNDESVDEIVIDDEIVGIPLTPEILEKNGWEERPTGYVFYTDGKRYDNSLWYIFGNNTFVVNNAEFQINYVHQLQHALKLCGIDKEIEL